MGDAAGPASLWRESIDGGAPVAPFSGSNETRAAFDGTSLFVVDEGSGDIVNMPFDGGAPRQVARAAAPFAWIAVDTVNVYWTQSSSTSGSVGRVPKGGGPSVVLSQGGPGYPGAIATDGVNVYWLDGFGPPTGAFVMSVPVGGGPTSTLASEQDNPSEIAVDATNVYWTNAGHTGVHGTVMRVSKAGGAPVILATGNQPCGVAVDANYVYWTDVGDNTVRRLRK